MCLFGVFFFFKQKTAYEMRISDWSSDVCSSDLPGDTAEQAAATTGLSADSMRQIVDQIGGEGALGRFADLLGAQGDAGGLGGMVRSEEHTSELQSLMRISYAVFCLKKKKKKQIHTTHNTLPNYLKNRTNNNKTNIK